jgi:hypothetical protein
MPNIRFARILIMTLGTESGVPFCTHSAVDVKFGKSLLSAFWRNMLSICAILTTMMLVNLADCYLLT